jgi:hypothetical protein
MRSIVNTDERATSLRFEKSDNLIQLPPRGKAVLDLIDFSRLGWKAFQDLGFAITTEVLGQTVEYFLPQKDGGRDGAFVGKWKNKGDEITGSFCIQCKYTSSNQKTLLARPFIEQEGRKIKKLVLQNKCDAYILLTNHPITHQQKDSIEKSLKAFGVRYVRVFSKDWLTIQIQKNSKLRMMIPRVYGLGDLGTILDQNAVRQGQVILSSLGDELQKFVITNVYKQAARAINEHSFVILLGAPASGKSTIAACLSLAALDRWKVETIKLTEPTDFLDQWSPGSEKRFFWIDDAFGATQLDGARVNKWNQILPHVYAAHKQGYRFVFTSRDYIFEGAKEAIKQTALPILFDSQVVIKVEDLTKSEKQQILYNHIKLGNQSRSFKSSIKEFLGDVVDQPGFMPEIARRLGTSTFTKNLYPDKENLLDFVSRPKEFLREVLTGLDKPSFTALGLIFINGGALPTPFTLSPEAKSFLNRQGVTEFAVSEALLRLDKSLAKLEIETNGSGWHFKHPTIADAYADLVSSDPQKIEYYLLGANIERIMAEVSCGVQLQYGQAIQVPDQLRDVVLRKMANVKDVKDVYRFLARRSDENFIKKYLVRYKLKPLDLLPPGGMLNVYPQVSLFVRLCEYGIPTSNEIDEYTEHCFKIAARIPETDFVNDEKYTPLFGSTERHKIIKDRFADAIATNIEARIGDQWAQSSSSEGVYWLNLIKEAIDFTKLDPRYANSIDLSNAQQKLLSYIDDLNDQDDDDDPNKSLYNDKHGKKQKLRSLGERSIFDDIDA